MQLNEKQLLKNSFTSYLSEKTFIREIDDNKLYTDNKIRNEFNDIIKRQTTIDNKFKPKLHKLIDSNFIIPCYVHESIMDRLENWLFDEGRTYTRFDNIVGFYHTEMKRIFIMLRNIQNFSYWSKNDLVSTTLIHEFQHCFLNLFPNSFVNLNRKSLDVYYAYFLRKYFDINESQQAARMLYQFLISNFDAPTSAKTDNKLLDEYMYVLQKLSTTKLKRQKFRQALLRYLSNINDFQNDVSRKILPSYELYITLRDCYSKLGILPRMINSLCVQEAIFAGEVICIESEYNRKNRHLVLIDRIKVN